jgi:hypothetical protein
MLLRAVGCLLVLVMAASGLLTLWSLFSEVGVSRFSLAVFIVSFLLVPISAIAAVWLQPGLTRRQRWDCTHRFMIGFSAYVTSLRYVIAGGSMPCGRFKRR